MDVALLTSGVGWKPGMTWEYQAKNHIENTVAL